MTWEGRSVLVTGGASFIGSHLTEMLVERGASVRVVDDLSSGSLDHLDGVRGDVELVEGNLLDASVARRACAGREVAFHLAAAHGGRGYVETRQAATAENLLLDGLFFREAVRAGVQQIVYASSGCVYPNALQQDPSQELFLREDDVGPPYDPDNIYGWAKLSAELTLRAYHEELGIGAASCRYFVVYGPRAREDHALMALIARAFVRQSPFEVWGTGEQVRNWTYVDDIVEGTIRAAERIRDGSAVNLGTMERITVRDAALLAQRLVGHDAPLVNLLDMPVGPLNRVADCTRARDVLDWAPRVPFVDGMARTVDWYVSTKDRADVEAILAGGGLFSSR